MRGFCMGCRSSRVVQGFREFWGQSLEFGFSTQGHHEFLKARLSLIKCFSVVMERKKYRVS